MRKLVSEIREQPEHIRHIFMWTMVVITFSLVGFVWFRSTSKQFVAMLNPEQAQGRALAQNEAGANKGSQPSPFATLFNSWQNLRANISELLIGSKGDLNIDNLTVPTEEELPPQTLPLSGNK